MADANGLGLILASNSTSVPAGPQHVAVLPVLSEKESCKSEAKEQLQLCRQHLLEADTTEASLHKKVDMLSNQLTSLGGRFSALKKQVESHKFLTDAEETLSASGKTSPKKFDRKQTPVESVEAQL